MGVCIMYKNENYLVKYSFNDKNGVLTEINQRRRLNLDNEREARIKEYNIDSRVKKIKFVYIPDTNDEETDIPNFFSERLSEAYMNENAKLEDLEKITNIPRATIQRYIKGKTNNIPYDRFVKLGKALDREIDELLGVNETLVGIEHFFTKDERMKSILMDLDYDINIMSHRERLIKYIASTQILSEDDFMKIEDYATMLAVYRTEKNRSMN